MTITASGDIGIGTKVPSAKLEVYQTTASRMLELDCAIATTGYQQAIAIKHSGTDMFTVTTGPYTTIAGLGTSGTILQGENVLFYTGGTNERMRITSGGNVGIGYTSPTAALAVNGNIGVGISSASQKIHVYGSGNQFIQVQTTDSGGNFGYFGMQSSGDSRIQTASGKDLIIREGSNVRLTVESGGNVDIPSGDLVVGDLITTDSATDTVAMGYGVNENGVGWNLKDKNGANTHIGWIGAGATTGASNYYSYGSTGISRWRSYDGTGYTTAMEINAAGNLAVTGTVTAPTFSGALTGNATTATTASKVTVTDHTGNNTEYPLVWNNNANSLYDTKTKLTFNPSTGRITSTGLYCPGDITTGSTNTSPATGNVQGAAVKTNGIVEVSCKTGSTPLRVNKGGTGTIVQFYIAGSAQGRISVAGGGAVPTFASGSDRRLKTDIRDMEGELENVLALRPVNFNMKACGSAASGFIAQEVQEIWPHKVLEDPEDEGMLSIAGLGDTDARIIKAIQEQQAIIRSLRRRVVTLEKATQP
jgi:hypothetical protein